VADFKIVGAIRSIEVIALGKQIRELRRLRKAYGHGRWKKLKGIATVQLSDDTQAVAEIHWYEAHGIGKKEFKIKRFLDQPPAS
jgi:hypothetical protein